MGDGSASHGAMFVRELAGAGFEKGETSESLRSSLWFACVS